MKSKIYTRLTMVFTAILMFAFAATSQTTINIKIVDANDDCEEVREVIDPTDAQGFMDHGSSDLELCTEDNLQYCGLVYRNVQIPAGATITNAYVQFTCDDDNDDDITLEIYGALDANVAAPIGEDLFSISKYTPTTAVVSWTPPPWMTLEERGPDQQTPDISSVIQEIIDLEGWAAGNNIMIVLTDDEPQKMHRESEAFEDNDGAGASELFVTYTEGAPQEETISVQILDPADDAEEYASDIGGEVIGGVDLTSSDLELVFDSETQFVGMIFRDVQVPKDATVTNAYVQFTVDAIVPGVTDAAISLEVYGAAEANPAAPFTEDLFSVSSHPSTTATVAWDPGPSVAEGDAGENEQTPDISAIINEIIAIDGWAAGNNMMIVVTGDPGQTENLNREMESADGDALSAPVLNITFTGGSGTGVNSVSGEFSTSIYPNPTEGKININHPSADKFGYEIYSISGKLVSSKHNITGPTTIVDMSNFVKGMYFVNVRTTEKTETHKIILK